MGGAAPARSERHSVGTERNGIDIILRPMANGLEPPECNLANIDHPAGISHRDQPRVLPRTVSRLAWIARESNAVDRSPVLMEGSDNICQIRQLAHTHRSEEHTSE